MAEDINDSKKKGLDGIQNLTNTKDAIESLDKDTKLDSLMSSLDSAETNAEEGEGNMLQYFMDLLQNLGGNESVKKVRKKIGSEIGGKIGEECKEIIFEELIQFINCNLDFVIPSADSTVGNVVVTDANMMTIPVRSVDPFKLLQNAPTTKVGKATYEKDDPVLQSFPYATNKELYERLENPSADQDYFGVSGQRLFTIEFDGTENYLIKPVGLDDTFNDNTTTTDNDRKITTFLRDYYDSIKIFEPHNFLANLLDALSGFLTVQSDLSGPEAELKGEFGALMNKLLNVCGDEGDGSLGNKINTSGVGHLSEDGDYEDLDKFFDFGDQELRDLNEEVNLQLNGLVKFVTCGDIEGEINIDEMNDAITSLLGETNPTTQGVMINTAIENAINGMSVDKSLGLGFELPNLKADFDFNVIKKLPVTLISLILTPKVLLGLSIALQAVGTFVASLDIMDLVKKFFRIIYKILKRIGELILEYVWEEVKKFIIQQVSYIVQQILKENDVKQSAIINSLVETLLSISEGLDDMSDCRSILDTLLGYITLPPVPPINIPKNLVAAAESRSGFSDVRALQNVMKNFSKSGINTEPMPDGSPNVNVKMAYSLIKGVEEERNKNGKVQISTFPASVSTSSGPGVTETGEGVGIML
jgi:hypothetical protein